MAGRGQDIGMMWNMKILEAVRRERFYDPHETARAQSLEGVPLASFQRRAAAFVVDFLLVLAIYIPADLAQQYIGLKVSHQNLRIDVHFDIRELEDLVFLVVYSGVLVWWTNGLTAGKRLLRIRVVSLKHSKISLWQAVERALGYGASSLEGGFGFVQYFIHHNRQCVHDRIAETIVVNERVDKRLPR
jgi:uncharacterized RDD family membrane protein YckC